MHYSISHEPHVDHLTEVILDVGENHTKARMWPLEVRVQPLVAKAWPLAA